MSISLCMIVKNEQEMLRGCLSAALPHVDEIVLVDTGSTDQTKQIATEFGAKVYEFTWNGSFSSARNKSLEFASSNYILVLDADERLPFNTRRVLEQFIKEHQTALGRVQIKSQTLAPDGHTNHVFSLNTRFFPNVPDVRYEGRIHEQIVDLSKKRARLSLDLVIEHEGYSLSPEALRSKTNRNMQLLQEQLRYEPRNAYYLYQLGKCYSVLDSPAQAHELYTLALDSGDTSDAYFPELLLATLYNLKTMKRQSEIWDLVAQYLSLYSRYTDLYFFIGLCMMEFKIANLDGIRQAFETCLLLGECGGLYPSTEGVGSFLALYNLGVYYEALQDYDKALEYYANSETHGYARAGGAIQRVKQFIY